MVTRKKGSRIAVALSRDPQELTNTDVSTDVSTEVYEKIYYNKGSDSQMVKSFDELSKEEIIDILNEKERQLDILLDPKENLAIDGLPKDKLSNLLSNCLSFSNNFQETKTKALSNTYGVDAGVDRNIILKMLGGNTSETKNLATGESKDNTIKENDPIKESTNIEESMVVINKMIKLVKFLDKENNKNIITKSTFEVVDKVLNNYLKNLL